MARVRPLVERALEAGLYFTSNRGMVRNQDGRRLVEALPRNACHPDAGPHRGHITTNNQEQRGTVGNVRKARLEDIFGRFCW